MVMVIVVVVMMEEGGGRGAGGSRREQEHEQAQEAHEQVEMKLTMSICRMLLEKIKRRNSDVTSLRKDVERSKTLLNIRSALRDLPVEVEEQRDHLRWRRMQVGSWFMPCWD